MNLIQEKALWKICISYILVRNFWVKICYSSKCVILQKLQIVLYRLLSMCQLNPWNFLFFFIFFRILIPNNNILRLWVSRFWRLKILKQIFLPANPVCIPIKVSSGQFFHIRSIPFCWKHNAIDYFLIPCVFWNYAVHNLNIAWVNTGHFRDENLRMFNS